MNVFESRTLIAWLSCLLAFQSAQAQPPATGPGAVPGPTVNAPIINDAPGQAVAGNYFGYSEVDSTFDPLLRVDTRGGRLIGQDGFTRISAFLPYWLEDDALLFADPGAMLLYNPSGGASLNVGWRYFVDDLDRVFGIHAGYDYDPGHNREYNQFTVGFESLGRYIDYRANGYLPFGNKTNVLSSGLNGQVAFNQNNIIFGRVRGIESAMTGFNAEVGGPIPILGRYGVSTYVGAYFFDGSDTGNITGFSSRTQGQVNEDLSVGVQVSHDSVFQTDVQMQVTWTIPDGAPGRWFRQQRVRDRLLAPVVRNYRVITRNDTVITPELAINPADGLPFFVAHVNPNRTPISGTGTFEDPFSTINQFDTMAGKPNVDIIYVTARDDDTSTQLNTGVTLLNNQRLLSTAVAHTFTAVQGTFALPGFIGGELPTLSNDAGGNVVTFATGNRNIEVSGFTINGSATGNGIAGVGNQRVNINRNEIQNGLNGIRLTNLTGTGANRSVIDNNDLIDNIGGGVNGNGLSIVNTAAAPLEIFITNNLAARNTGNGFRLQSDTGSLIGGRITGNTTADTGAGTSNAGDGLALFTDGGDIDFHDAANGWRIGGTDPAEVNSFSDNEGSGISATPTNNGDVRLRIINNDISRNLENGFEMTASDGTHILEFGGADPARGNRIESNVLNGIFLDLNGTSVTSLNIQNNLISGGGGQIVPTIGTNFLGSTFNDSGFIPPDTMGSVGLNHIVEMLNGVFAIYDKTGAQISSTSLDAFFDSVTGITRGDVVFDPRIIFDPTTNRWFATAIDGGAGNSIYIAVSDTSDPTGSWSGTQFVGDTIDGSRFNDYVTMGIDANSVVFGTNNFGSGFDVSIFSIPKADLIDGNPDTARLTRFEALNAGTFGSSIQAAVDFGAFDGSTQLLADLGAGTNLARTDLNGTGGAGATIGLNTTVAVPNYTAGPPGRQPAGAPVDNVSPRIGGNVVEVGDSLWAAHAVAGTSGNSAVRWYEIDATTNTVLQTGLIEDPTLDFLDPSIAVNASGAVMIGYSGGGPGQFMSSMASVGRTTGGVTSFNAPVVLQAGTANYERFDGLGRNRWGDYSATVVDPTNPNRFWTFQERVAATDVWGVQITAVDLAAPSGATGDNIHIEVSDTALLNPATIQDNTITQAGRHGIYVNTDGGVTIPDLQIRRNDITNNTQSGVFLDRFDSSTQNVTLDGNNISNNLGNGLTANAQDLAAGGIFINSVGNNYNDNGGHGVSLLTFDTADIDFDSDDDTMSGNSLSGVNMQAVDNTVILFTADRSTMSDNSANGVNAQTENSAFINVALHNVIADDNGQDGFNGEATDTSLIQLLIDSPVDPLFTGTNSSLSGNGGNGVQVATDVRARFVLTMDNVDLNNNVDGLNFSRVDTSLIQATLNEVNANGNTSDGLDFFYAGALPSDPQQPLSGTPNTLFITDSSFNTNGANGMNIEGRADAVLLANVATTSFNNNGASGVFVETFEDASFGVSAVNRSIFSGVTANGNGANGMQFDIGVSPPFGSFQFVTIDAAAGNTLISGNTGNGIEINAFGTTADFLIEGTPGAAFTTQITGNTGDGVEVNVGTSADVTIRDVTISNNGADGIDVNNASFGNTITIGAAGDSTIIQNNGGSGISFEQSGSSNIAGVIENVQLLDNDEHGLSVVGDGTSSDGSFPGGYFVSLVDSEIRRNGFNGVNILLTRHMDNQFVIDNNLIFNNGTQGTDDFTTNGVFVQLNAQDTLKSGQPAGTQDPRFRRIQINPNSAFPIAPNNPDLLAAGNYGGNYRNLTTTLDTELVFTRNTVNFNGNNGIGSGDGVYFRVSTNSFLSADVGGAAGSGLGNSFSGNTLADFRTGSFIATDASGAQVIPANGIPAADPLVNPSFIFLDDAAQLDLRFKNNTGTDLNPSLNERAFYTNADPAKNNLSRNAQLFRIDGPAADINNTNNFTQPGFPGTESQRFQDGGYQIVTPLFP